MSCCADSYNNIPCCCSIYITTTTTCPFGICCEPACEDGTSCVDISSTDCVFYEGPTVELDCLGVTISQGESYTQVLEAIMSNIKPINLLSISFFYSITYDDGPPVNFTSSLQSACQALTDYNSSPIDYGFNGNVYYVVSLTVNQKVYINNTDPLNCTLAPDGYYVVLDYNNTDDAVVYVVNGIINSITTC